MIKPIIPKGQLDLDLYPLTHTHSPTPPLGVPGGGEASTPYSNTGSKSQHDNYQAGKGFGNWEQLEDNESWSAWYDYLQGCAVCNWYQLRQLTERLSNDATDKYVLNLDSYRYVGNQKYRHSYSSLLGVTLNFNILDTDSDIESDGIADFMYAMQPSTRLSLHISIPGKPLNAMGVKNALLLLEQLHEEYQFSCTRIDAKVRDYKRVTSISAIDDAISRGDIKGFSKYLQFNSGDLSQRRRASTDGNAGNGYTRTFGSPQSDKRVTFYDALPVHGCDAMDIEVRYRSSLARNVCQQILGTKADNYNWGQRVRIIGGIVAGAIDFIHRLDGERNLDRCPRYDFWKQFQALMDKPIRISRPKRSFDIVKQKEWIERKCYRSLAIVKETMGSAYFHKWMDDVCKRGKAALTSLHEAQISLYKELNLHKVKFVPYRNADISEVIAYMQ
jgi:hypothetical protein